MFRFLAAAILLMAFAMSYATTTINATIPKNHYYFLGSHDALDKSVGAEDFPRKRYEIKRINSGAFTLANTTDPSLKLDTYNDLLMTASLEFLSFNKTTDDYIVKITLLPGVSFSSFHVDESRKQLDKGDKFLIELKQATIVFAETKQSAIIISGKLNRKVDEDTVPIIEHKHGDFALSLTGKGKELTLITVNSIPLIIEDK